MRPSAPPGTDVKLHVAHGDVPEFGTELVTPSGRRYQVIGGRGKTLRCLVLAPDAPVQGPVWQWTWTARNKRREP